MIAVPHKWLFLRAAAESMTRQLPTLLSSSAIYDEVLAYFTRALGFETMEDTVLGDSKRRVLIAPQNSQGRRIFSPSSSLDHGAAGPSQPKCRRSHNKEAKTWRGSTKSDRLQKTIFRFHSD